jgi:hypothetical protein
MAIVKGKEVYTQWSHCEHGNVHSRRIHRLTVCASDGRILVFTGHSLPDLITTQTGYSQDGDHFMDVFLKADRLEMVKAPETPLIERKNRVLQVMWLFIIMMILDILFRL